MYFGDNIQMFILQAFKEDTPLFKFLEENNINMVFSNNKLYCNKDNFIKAYDKLVGPNHLWPSILRNFNYHRMRVSYGSPRDGSIIITFPEDFSLDKPFNRHSSNLRYLCEFPGCGYVAKQRGSLYKHMYMHRNKGNNFHPCLITGCRYRTTEINNLRQHIQRIHIDDQSTVPDVDEQSKEPVVDEQFKEPDVNEQSKEPDLDDQSKEPDVDDQMTVLDENDINMATI